MKRLLTMMLAVLMVLSLAACSSGEGSAPAKKNCIEETDYLVPDEVTSVKSTSNEKGADEKGTYDNIISFNYEKFEDAIKAHEEYAAYLDTEFPNRKDSNGYKIALSNPAMNESTTLKVAIRQGVVITDALVKELTGKYVLVAIEGDETTTDYIMNSWNDRSYYWYYEITADQKVISYSVDNGTKTTEGTYELEQFLDFTNVKYENGSITVDNSGELTIYEKTDEIPD